LDEKYIQYEICSDLELMKSKGFRSLPILEVNGKVMTFNNAIMWVKEI